MEYVDVKNNNGQDHGQSAGHGRQETRQGLTGVVSLVRERYAGELTLPELAAAAGMPTNTLTRHFNRRYGMSPMRWLWAFRTILAAELIAENPEAPLAEICARCGFTSSAHFSRRFREVFKESPSRFRANFRTGGRQGATQVAQSGPESALARALAKSTSGRF